MVDRALISKETLRRYIMQESDWMEQHFLFVPMEPALVVSDFTISNATGVGSGLTPPTVPADNLDYDIMCAPISYMPANTGHWMSITVPYGWPILFEYMEGVLDNSRVVSLNTDWLQFGQSRYVEVVPYKNISLWTWMGVNLIGTMRGPWTMPSLWRYRYWAGVRDEKTPISLVEAVGLRAASKALAILGQMYRGGFASQSVSREGVSESVSYTASATYGIYSATITDFQRRLQELMPQLRKTYHGIQMAVL
jgi:hypothetical protein